METFSFYFKCTRAIARPADMKVSNSKKVLKSDTDRLSVLPDSMLHHILSFLDMKDVVGTSLLSTRWKNLWKSVPVLNFSHSLWQKKSRDKRSKKLNKIVRSKRLNKIGFIEFVDTVLNYHDSSSISRIQICCSSYCDMDLIEEWLVEAVDKQIPEINLDFHSNEPTELPDCIFSSAVTSFKFLGRGRGDIPIRIPNSICSSQLKTLILRSVQLPRGDLNGELVLKCPVLENLELKDCFQEHLKVFDISTVHLKNLVLENYHLERLGPCQIKIRGPILESLNWGGLLYENCCLHNLSSLVTAKFEILQVLPNTQNIVKLLEGVSCATIIELTSCLEYSHGTIDELTSRFSNLRRLKLVSKYPYKAMTHVMLELLKCSPFIETLVVEGNGLEDYYEELYPSMFRHLKSVELGRVKGSQTELRFIKLLLENAAFLAKLKVKMVINLCVSAKENFLERIHSLPRASSSIALLLI